VVHTEVLAGEDGPSYATEETAADRRDLDG
jgi:hypothetical protein